MRKAKRLTIDPPRVVIPTVTVRQVDGSILSKAGKPIILEDELGISEAARLLGMSCRWVQTQCELGNFKTAHKPGLKDRSQWRIARSEVIARAKSQPG